jgi:hypothetical protein
MPDRLRRETVMVAPSDTRMVPMRVSKAVALGGGDDLPNRALRERFFTVLDELDGDRALNLAVLTHAPVLVAPQALADYLGRQEGDSAEAALLRRAAR